MSSPARCFAGPDPAIHHHDTLIKGPHPIYALATKLQLGNSLSVSASQCPSSVRTRNLESECPPHGWAFQLVPGSTQRRPPHRDTK